MGVAIVAGGNGRRRGLRRSAPPRSPVVPPQFTGTSALGPDIGGDGRRPVRCDSLRPMELGRFGIWTFTLDPQPAARAQELAAEIESLGYGAIWLPEAVGRDPLVSSALLLSATERISVATGIASIYARDAMAMASGHRALSEWFPGRFVLGL